MEMLDIDECCTSSRPARSGDSRCRSRTIPTSSRSTTSSTTAPSCSARRRAPSSPPRCSAPPSLRGGRVGPAEGIAWSVVVKGHAVELERLTEVLHAEDLPLVPWNGSYKPRFVTIEADEISGRRFHVSPASSTTTERPSRPLGRSSRHVHLWPLRDHTCCRTRHRRHVGRRVRRAPIRLGFGEGDRLVPLNHRTSWLSSLTGGGVDVAAEQEVAHVEVGSQRGPGWTSTCTDADRHRGGGPAARLLLRSRSAASAGSPPIDVTARLQPDAETLVAVEHHAARTDHDRRGRHVAAAAVFGTRVDAAGHQVVERGDEQGERQVLRARRRGRRSSTSARSRDTASASSDMARTVQRTVRSPPATWDASPVVAVSLTRRQAIVQGRSGSDRSWASPMHATRTPHLRPAPEPDPQLAPRVLITLEDPLARRAVEGALRAPRASRSERPPIRRRPSAAAFVRARDPRGGPPTPDPVAQPLSSSGPAATRSCTSVVHGADDSSRVGALRKRRRRGARCRLSPRRDRRPVRGAPAPPEAPPSALGSARVHEVRLGPLAVDLGRREIQVNGHPVAATRLEFDLFAQLCRHPRKCAAVHNCWRAVWGPGWVGDTHVVDVHLSNLRRKLRQVGQRPAVHPHRARCRFPLSDDLLRLALPELTDGTSTPYGLTRRGPVWTRFDPGFVRRSPRPATSGGRGSRPGVRRSCPDRRRV